MAVRFCQPLFGYHCDSIRKPLKPNNMKKFSVLYMTYCGKEINTTISGTDDKHATGKLRNCREVKKCEPVKDKKTIKA
jgi:hypothetical protein